MDCGLLGDELHDSMVISDGAATSMEIVTTQVILLVPFLGQMMCFWSCLVIFVNSIYHPFI